ncbi:MAG: putative Ig domain-containing protein, partial [Candidatus Puniceispirillaceae bacterium]
TVFNTNDAPKFVTTSLPAAIQDSAFEMVIEVMDDDIQHGDVMRFKLADGPDWLQISKDGMLGGTPANADVGDHIVVIVLSDKAGTTIQKEFKLKVENINDAPVFITSNRK